MEKLPADFLFGVGCSDHQCEAYDSAYPPDVWDWWEQDGKVPQSRGQAVDFWNRYPEHLRLAHELGCTTFRFSIAWARVEPSPGVFDPAVLQHYAELAAAAREQGMEPIVTLCHYVWPMHLERAGGLASADFPGRFAAYARRVRDALSPHVRYWITFNEPNDLVVSHSQFQSRFPPNSPTWTSFRDQMRGMEVLIRNIFLANRDARAVLHDVPSGPSAMVGMNTDLRGFPVGVRRLLNWWVTRYHQSAHHVRNIVGAIVPRRSTETLKPGPLNFLRTLVMLFDGDWSELGALGRLPRHLCPEGCANQLDYLAFDWYYGVRWVWDILKLTSSLDGHFERSPVYSPGLFETLRYFDRLFKAADPPAGKPIFIMENGSVDQPGAYQHLGEIPPPGVVDRAQYLRDHVRQIQRARAAGVNVIGYCAWSLTSNREWGLRFSPGTDFGLYNIDLDNDPGLFDRTLPLTMKASPAVEAFREIIARRGVEV